MDKFDETRIIKEKKLKLIDIYDDLIHVKIKELVDEEDYDIKAIIENQINELIEKLINAWINIYSYYIIDVPII